VTEEMVGHKFGEFSPTRTFYGHAGGQEGEEEVSHEQAETPRALADNEAQAVPATSASPAASSTWLPQLIRGKKVARRRADLTFAQAHRRRREEVRWRAPLPTPKTTTTGCG
jgi:hypothetical protein